MCGAWVLHLLRTSLTLADHRFDSFCSFVIETHNEFHQVNLTRS